jgi:TetR/AcrR family transcriptional regulator, regulator of cefoperazone and chloramphenicol sensitivity
MTPAADTSPLKISPSHETRKQRTDGAEARQLLLHAALRLFSEKGFSKTSTREIALAAGANIGAISYYFGDKAGLYRAAFTEPLGCAHEDSGLFDRPDFSLRQSLQAFISSFLAPMKQGELVQQCTRLHFREMLEPTGLWREEIDNAIKPAHVALVALLGRHLGVQQADDGLHRLAFSIAGLALQLFLTRDCVQAIRPELLAQPEAIDAWAEQMVMYAEAMVAIEAAQRQLASGPIVQEIDQKNQKGQPA